MVNDVVVTDLIATAEETEGAFDALFKVVETKLTEQYTAGRLTGTDYANVYLGSIQSAIAQSIQFVLTAHTANKQADLLEQQVLTEVQNTAKVTAETTLVGSQSTLALEQVDKLTSEIALVNQKTLTEIQSTALVTAQTGVQTAQEAMLTQQRLSEIQNTLLITSTKNKTDSEIILIDNKAATELQVALRETATTSRLNAETTKLGSENTLIINKQATEVNTTAKVLAEKELLTQKTETELGQVSDLRLDGITAVAGIVGAQKDLYVAQKEGFARDAEQKVLKILADTWGVARSTDTLATVDLPTPIGNTTTFAATINEVKLNAGLV